MPIEFKCSHCENVLKVADKHAGKSARCPSCKNVTSIPPKSDSGFASETPTEDLGQLSIAANMPNPFADPQLESKPIGSGVDNPYRSPATTKLEGRPLKQGTIIPTAVSFDEIFGAAWKIWKDNLGLLVGVTVAVTGIPYVFLLPYGILSFFAAEVGAGETIQILIDIFGNLLFYTVQLFLQIGSAIICLKLARRQPALFPDLFSGSRYFLSAFGATVLFTLAVFVGMILLLVPGVLVALYFWPYFQLIVDGKAKAIESFNVASKIAGLNVGTSFVLGLVSFLLVIGGGLMCLVGLLFTLPLFSMIIAIAYLKMSGQMR